MTIWRSARHLPRCDPATPIHGCSKSRAVEWRTVLGWQDTGAGDDAMLPSRLSVADGTTTTWRANSDVPACQPAAQSSHAREGARTNVALPSVVGYAGGAERRASGRFNAASEKSRNKSVNARPHQASWKWWPNCSARVTATVMQQFVAA